MTLRYDITKDDFIAFQAYHTAQSKKGRFNRILLFLALAFLFLRMTVLGESAIEYPWLTFFLLMCAMALLFTIFGKFLSRLGYKYKLKNVDLSGALGAYSLTLKDGFMESKNARVATKIPYADVAKICYPRRYLYIFLGAHSALTIPLSAFSSTEQREAFLDFLYEKTGKTVRFRRFIGILR